MSRLVFRKLLNDEVKARTRKNESRRFSEMLEASIQKAAWRRAEAQ